MLTTHEKRVLYVLQKHGGRAKKSTISQAMSRCKAAERAQALANCEDLKLISSAKTPPGKGGPGSTVYWLTSEGKDVVEGLIASGDMTDPLDEPRRGKGGRRAAR